MKMRHAAAACSVAIAAGLTLGNLPLAQAVPAAPHGPKNVIVMIGDGMGYNQIAASSLYENGVSYKQVVGTPGNVQEVEGTAAFPYEQFPVQVDMSTYWVEGSYDPAQAWSDFEYVKKSPTDSAAAGTAMATGVKTYNAGLGVDAAGNPVENISERAISMGKAAGSISSVQYSHATPASYVVHNQSRNDYLGIASEEVASDMTVIMGAGHPEFNDNGEKIAAPKYKYISEDSFTDLRDGVDGWNLVEDKAGFEALTTGETPDRVFGIAPVATTLQQARAGESKAPYDVAFNKTVPSLETMTKGALNVLDNDPDGFSLMVEGGAIDWAGHANDGVRNIEETLEFNKAVNAVIDWVETNSNWRETMLIVTADHETGYLEGVDANPSWTLLTGEQGKMPNEKFFSGDHTNQLVPVYAMGAGSKELARLATSSDPVRGAYLDNTDLANLFLDDFWAEGNKGKAKGKYNGSDNAYKAKSNNGKAKGHQK